MDYLNAEQVEQLKEIGTYLQQKRQTLSIPLEEVAAKTLIRPSMLKALEEGQIDLLPEPIFVQGFIRRYGDALQVDGSALAKNFSTNTWPAQSNVSFQNLPTLPGKVLIIYVVYSLLLGAAVWGLLYLLNRPPRADTIVQSKKSPAAPIQKIVNRHMPSLSAIPKTSQSSFPIQITANIKDNCSLRVIVDGKTQFEDTLKKGQNKSWTAKKELTLRAGDAGAVAISFNQGEPKILGKIGEIKEVTFSPHD